MSHGWHWRRSIVWAALLLLVSSLASARSEVQMQLSAQKVEVGQEVRVRLEGSSDEQSLGNPRLRVPPGIVTQGPSLGTSQSIGIVGGRVERSVRTTATWILTATQPGTFEIGPGTFTDAGHVKAAGTQKLEVVPEGTLPPARGRRGSPFDDPLSGFGPGGSIFDNLFGGGPRRVPSAPSEYQLEQAPDPHAFLRATLTPRTVVVGEQVTLRVYAYGSRGPFSEGASKEARHPDFFSHPIVSNALRQRSYGVDIGGREYHTIKVRELALFPLKSGRLEVGAMSMGFDSRQGRYATAQQPHGIERSTPPLTITVTEPPSAGRPAGFQSGNVGDFELNAEVSPRQVEAGGSISVVATLTGTGRLPEELITPELKGVAWLEPSLEDEIQVDHQGTLGGQRVFTYLVRLDTVGQVDLGTLSLPHYSPRSRRYHVARARLGTVQVIAGPGPVDASEAQSPGSVKLSAELDPRRAPRGTARASWLAADRPWFFPGLLALPSLVLLVRASKAAVANARRLGESRRASPSTLAKKALADANRQFRQGEAASGLASVERALFLSLEAATGIRGRAVLRSELADALARAGLDPELAECVVALLKRTEQVRFAGANAAFDQLMGEAARCVRRILSSRSPTEVRAG